MATHRKPKNLLGELAASAYRIRRYAIRMGEVQGQGYIGQALGWADVLAVAYRHAMKFRPEDPKWEGRDRFLLSHGHYAIAFYAARIDPPERQTALDVLDETYAKEIAR